MQIGQYELTRMLTRLSIRHLEDRMSPFTMLLSRPDLIEELAGELTVQGTDTVARLDVDAPCPISLGELLSVEWNPMTAEEVMSFAGIDGEGWIAHYRQESTGRTYVLTADDRPSRHQSLIQVHWSDSTATAIWQVDVPAGKRIL